jgi:hypothetical protein
MGARLCRINWALLFLFLPFLVVASERTRVETRHAALFKPKGMDEGRSVEFDNWHGLFLRVEHQVGEKGVLFVVVFAEAKVFDKVLVSVLEQALLGTRPRVIGPIGRRGHAWRGSILPSLALVLDRYGRSVKRPHKFVINRNNFVSPQQVVRGMNNRVRSRGSWVGRQVRCQRARRQCSRRRGRAGQRRREWDTDV